MISRNLAVALMETIRAHAEHHHHGKMDLGRTLSALGELASGLLAELTAPKDIRAHYGELVQRIAQQTARKLAGNPRPTTTQ
jgi:hypothetical protein